MFGPVAVVAAGLIGLRKKGAVPPMFAFDQGDVRIRDYLLAALRRQADERIVQRMQNEGRHSNAVQHPRGGRTIVIVVGTAEAGVERRNAIVELTQRAD